VTRAEWAARLEARAAEAEQLGALAPVAAVLRNVLAELETVDGLPTARPAPDVMLTLAEAAERLNVPKRWLTENRHQLPFLKHYARGTVRASAADLARWIATR